MNKHLTLLPAPSEYDIVNSSSPNTDTTDFVATHVVVHTYHYTSVEVSIQ